MHSERNAGIFLISNGTKVQTKIVMQQSLESPKIDRTTFPQFIMYRYQSHILHHNKTLNNYLYKISISHHCMSHI